MPLFDALVAFPQHIIGWIELVTFDRFDAPFGSPLVAETLPLLIARGIVDFLMPHAAAASAKVLIGVTSRFLPRAVKNAVAMVNNWLRVPPISCGC